MKKLRHLTGMVMILLIVIFMNLGVQKVQAEVYSGTCGATEEDDVRWTFDTDSGLVYISGHGKMRDWNWETEARDVWRLYKSHMQAVIVENGVTHIGNAAFFSCVTLKYIYLPTTIESLGDYCFKNCKSLVGINVSGKVTYIGSYAFGDCRNFRYIELQEGLETIGQGAFKDCVVLKKITLPSTLKKISANAFMNCYELEDLKLPSNLQEIGKLAFRDCCSLKKLELPSGVKSIGNGAFRNCTSLSVIELPYNLTQITSVLFDGCTNLRYVHIPSSVTSISEDVFAGCDRELMVNIDDYYFAADLKKYCEDSGVRSMITTHQYNGFIYNIYDGKAVITGYNGNAWNMKIPECIDGAPVTAIMSKTFEGDYNLVTLELPSTLEKIGTKAFYKCYCLVEILNHSALELSVGASDNGGVASSALNIRKSTEEPSVVSIDTNKLIYAGNKKIKYIVGYLGNAESLVLPDSYIDAAGETVNAYAIMKYAFYNKSIKEVDLGNAVTEVGSSSFSNCTNLQKVQIRDSINLIGVNVFNQCSDELEIVCYEESYAQKYAEENSYRYTIVERPPVNVEECIVTLSQEVLEWGGGETKPDVSVTHGETVLVPDVDYTVEYTDTNALGLTSLTVTGIGKYTGTVTKEYTVIVESEHTYLIGDYQMKVTNLNSDFSGGSVVVTGCGNNNLKNVEIPDNIVIMDTLFTVEGIEDNAFAKCSSVQSVVIGKNIKRIGDYAFYKCKNLKKIVVYTKKIEYFGENSIKNIRYDAKIYVMKSRKKRYAKYLFTERTGYSATMKIKDIESM